MVLDADGINALSGHIDILRKAQAPVILTPHKGEFARISGVEPAQSEDAAQGFAQDTGSVLLLKSHRTLLSAPDGRQARNTTGNPGMAKGGSGDVLAGMLLSLLGQGIPAFEAACMGAWLHGAAGDRCAAEIGEYGKMCIRDRPGAVYQKIAQDVQERLFTSTRDFVKIDLEWARDALDLLHSATE